MKGVAIVTGGGRGIGRATAEALSADGWSVVVAGRTAENLHEVVSGLDGNGLAVTADVSIAADVERLFASVVDRYDRVDLLFNNAGISAPAVPVDELDIETWHRVVAINLTGAFLCARAAFAQMRNQSPRGGRIINNGSVSATTPRPYSAPYTATKHAITGLTKSLALDGRDLDICCGQIDLGNVKSDMVEQMSRGVLQANGSVEPEPTIAVDNVTSAILYMASLPLDANVLSMTVMANSMPFVGRG